MILVGELKSTRATTGLTSQWIIGRYSSFTRWHHTHAKKVGSIPTFVVCFCVFFQYSLHRESFARRIVVLCTPLRCLCYLSYSKTYVITYVYCHACKVGIPSLLINDLLHLIMKYFITSEMWMVHFLDALWWQNLYWSSKHCILDCAFRSFDMVFDCSFSNIRLSPLLFHSAMILVNTW